LSSSRYTKYTLLKQEVPENSICKSDLSSFESAEEGLFLGVLWMGDAGRVERTFTETWSAPRDYERHEGGIGGSRVGWLAG